MRSSQSLFVDSHEAELSSRVDSANETLRLAVLECGWTLDALSSHSEIDKSLISRVLTNDRPLTQKFLDAMPDEIVADYEKRRCRARGFIVVEPVDEETAQRYLAIALFSTLAKLPAKATGQIKAELKPGLKARTA